MSGQRAAAEPYATRFETEVSAVDGRTVWLETTYFYARSGGQPADRGTIGDVAVEDVRYVDGEHVHVLAEEPAFRAGHRVMCSIDWSYRMYCMRAHTASHALYGAGRRLFDAADLAYAGVDIGEERIGLDVETDAELDDGTLVELDRLLNRVVWESRPVSWETIPVAEARERDEVAFDETAEIDALNAGRVRIVTIGSEDDNGPTTSRDPWDVTACSGTHVRNTREIGPVTVLGRSSPDESITRLEFAVGPRAIERRKTEKRATFATKDALGVPIGDVPEEVTRLRDETDALASALTATRRSLLEARLELATPVDRDGNRWLVTRCRSLPPEFLSDTLGAVLDDLADVDVLAVVGETDFTFAVVGSASDRSAAAIVDDLISTFGGGGGGSSRLAQGGGFDVSPETIVDSLE